MRKRNIYFYIVVLSVLMIVMTALLFSCDSGGDTDNIGDSTNDGFVTDDNIEDADTEPDNSETEYTVNFDSMGGSAVESQTVKYGETISIPVEPTKEGYNFVGWCTTADGSVSVDFTLPITSNVTYYAKWNEQVGAGDLLVSLLNGYRFDPMRFVPDTMKYDYVGNLVDANSIVKNYSSGFVNTSSIKYGVGEQWNMVLNNLIESERFFVALNVVDTVSAASITAFNNYIDSNPSDMASYSFKEGIYNVTIKFDAEILYYVLDYTAEISGLGEQSVQIALGMNVKTGDRVGRIQFGDANAMSYRMSGDSYEFAIKYLGVRRAMFTFEENSDGSVSGGVYEYLSVEERELVSSVAEFCITEDYVSIVGNKAGGMLGFEGYICELYTANDGRMCGYEVSETLASIQYNTLWFDLNDVLGINSIKYVPKNGDVPAKIYINGASKVWETMKVGGLSFKTASRRFDIEFRTQYVYSYDSVNDKYLVHEIQVPMLFVQEENYSTFIRDVKDVNGVDVEVRISSLALDKLMRDYDTMIPVLDAKKDKITAEYIVEYIGEKKEF